jgi:hypothetical protein
MTLSYFMIEGFYKVPTLFPYNGNVLIDNASDIVPEKKEEPKPPVVAAVIKDKPKTIPPPVTKPKEKEKSTKSDSQLIVSIPTKKKDEPKKEEPKKEEELSPDRLREGQTIKIEKLQFALKQLSLQSPRWS